MAYKPPMSLQYGILGIIAEFPQNNTLHALTIPLNQRNGKRMKDINDQDRDILACGLTDSLFMPTGRIITVTINT
jgi:hypothetical protein